MNTWLWVDLNRQQISLKKDDEVLFSAPISSGKNGVGERQNSGQTPRGWHVARAMIGQSLPCHSVLVARRPTGEIYHEELAKQYPNRDWILSRIIWLSGLEPGKNRGGDVDTMRRFIYIHGAPDELMINPPQSHGCIRMYNQDIITLFNLMGPGTRVYIHHDPSD